MEKIIKKLYNKILYKLYRGRTVDFEELFLGKKRPLLFCTRLYSPSLYEIERGRQCVKWFNKGLKQGIKEGRKMMKQYKRRKAKWYSK